jgi:hypothetical protein
MGRTIASALALTAIALLSDVAGTSAWHVLPPGKEGFRDAGYRAIRGVTVGPIESSQQPGRGYGTDYSAVLLDELARMDAGWVSITPFGRLWSLEDTAIRMDFEAPYDENRVAVRRMVAQAHARGLRAMVIPHLWVETSGWRGEVDPGTEEGWEAYQESYREFILRWAEDASLAGADAFSIGVECKSWSGRFGRFWRSLIGEVRSIFPGLLTYSANWDEAEDVLFWDQLDLIGINAFYPLADHESATFDEYLAGAEAIVPNVEALATVLDMPVLFVEVGYTTRRDAAVEPWLWPDDMAEVIVDEHEQARGLEAMFRAFVPEPWFAGFFVWRYYTNIDDVSQEAIWGFSPHGKAAETLLAETFAGSFGADPPAWPWVDHREESFDAYPFRGLFPVVGTDILSPP